jgi:hypothetical protein
VFVPALVEPRHEGKVSAARLLAGTAVAAGAATLFVVGNDRDDSLAFFLAWLFLHVLYGSAVGSFWVLAVVLSAPPLFVAAFAGSNGDDTPLWLQAASVELFYGVPFAFAGVLGRRLWQARRPPKLPGADAREGRRP